MKKFFIYMASAAFMFAACNQAEIEAPVEDNNTNIEDVMPVETETITVDLNPMTKTSLDGMNTVWSAGDEVSVTVAGKNIGNLKLVGGSTFSGEVEAGHNGDAILNYPAGVTAVPTEQKAVENSFANGAALLEGTTTMDALRNGKGASLQNKTALLKFKSARSGNVAFTVGTETYTVTECEANKEYYASIAPAAEALLSYTLSGNAGTKSVTTSFEAGKIYSLGTLTEEFVPQEGYVYLIPNDNWKSDNARFAAYFFSQTWVSMTLVEGQVNVYQSAIPEGEKGGMLFCRMNPNNTENRWNVDNEANAPVWNQTIDLSLTDGCVYTMNEGSWDTGTWTGNPAVEKPVLPEVAPGVDSDWALAGTFNAWGNKIFKTTSTSGLFVIENLALDSGDEIKVKVVANWNTSYGGGIVNLKQNCWMKVYSNGANIPVSAKGTYDVYFDQLNTKLYLMAAGVDYASAVEQTSNGPAPTTPSEWYIVGNFNGWNPADSNYRMSDDGTYYIYDNFTAASGCELKFAPGKWSNDRGASSFKVGSWVNTSTSGNNNIKVTAGTYKIYLKKDLSQYKFEKK